MTPADPTSAPPSEDGAGGRTIDTVSAEVKADPDALLSDSVLEFAIALDDVSFERFKRKLSAHVRTPEIQGFVRAVKARAKEQSDARKSGRGQGQDDRPQILITVDEGAVNEQAARALARIPGLYSRMGELVRIVESKRRRPGEEHPYTVTDIRVVTEPLLREYFARAAQWVEPSDDETKPAHPPDWSVKAVRNWHDWPTLPPLYHVAESPVLLPDGRVIQRHGYDRSTGIFCNTKITVEVPEEITRDDARAAAAMILDLVAQVPFENDAHRSAWLAAMLSVIARWAFRGQCPLFILDANKEGTGKGFLVSIISGIVLGRPCDLIIQTADEDEERKRITSKILTAQPMVLIDEVDKPFGSGAIQGLLTSGVWSDRLLGGNEAPSYPAYIVWLAAGNNVQLKSGDIARRTCFIRIVTDLDNPAERTGFKYDDMDAHIAKHRAELFRAAVIMVRAWLLSGLKPSDLGEAWLGRWGSFDDWDRVVRGAIVYAGLADPKSAKATAVAPTIKEGLADLVLGLEEAIASTGHCEASISDIHSALANNDEARKDARSSFGLNIPVPAVNLQRLRKGIHSMLPHLKGATPSGQQLGTLLGKNAAQAVKSEQGQRKWIKYRHSDGGLWRVDIVPEETAHVPAPEPTQAQPEAPEYDPAEDWER